MGPLPTSETGEARNWAVFLIFGPLSISGTTEDINLKFGIWLDYARYRLAGDKLPPKNVCPGSSTVGKLFRKGHVRSWG